MLTVPQPPSIPAPAWWAQFYRSAAIMRLLAKADPAGAEAVALRRLSDAQALVSAAADAAPGVLTRVSAEVDRVAAENAAELVGWIDDSPYPSADIPPAPPLTPELIAAFQALAARRRGAPRRFRALVLDFVLGGDRFLRLDDAQEFAAAEGRPSARVTR